MALWGVYATRFQPVCIAIGMLTSIVRHYGKIQGWLLSHSSPSGLHLGKGTVGFPGS
jgi:hypothetical protein